MKGTKEPSYQFCFNDKPLIKKMKTLNLIDEIGEENINTLKLNTEEELYNIFKVPFTVLYNLSTISNNFKQNNTAILDISSETFNRQLRVSKNFNNFFGSIEKTLKNKIVNGKLNSTDLLNGKLVSPNLSESIKVWPISIPLDTYVAMGGTQETRYQVNVYKKLNTTNFDLKDYIINIDFEIYDIFGFDLDDINSGSKGEDLKFKPLRAGFMLQHYHGYKPFYTKIKYSINFTYD